MWSSRFTEVISWKPQPHNPPSSQDWKHSNTSRWMVNDKAPHYMRYWGFYPQELCTGTYGSGRLPLYILLVGFTDPFFSLFLIRFFFFCLFLFCIFSIKLPLTSCRKHIKTPDSCPSSSITDHCGSGLMPLQSCQVKALDVQAVKWVKGSWDITGSMKWSLKKKKKRPGGTFTC